MTDAAHASGKRRFRDDLDRYLILIPRKTALHTLRLVAYSPGLWVTFFYRIGHRLTRLAAAHRVFRLISVPYSYLYFLLGLAVGIEIPLDTEIGPGFYIGHWGGIIVHSKTVVGCNCNISHGVTIGEGGRGEGRGVPSIGDRVYIGPGAKLFGDITVGNDVAIGANAVVNKSVPAGAVVGGIPAEILSMKGSADFVVVRDDEAQQ